MFIFFLNYGECSKKFERCCTTPLTPLLICLSPHLPELRRGRNQIILQTFLHLNSQDIAALVHRVSNKRLWERWWEREKS